ncbi:MAG: iron-containing alcohol dehydrogenase, partial [Gemmataceae bacterium]
GVALVHAMEYPVGGAVHVSHGAGNGLLLPFVMRYNAAARADEIGCLGLWLGGRAMIMGDAPVGDTSADAVARSLQRTQAYFDDAVNQSIAAVEQLRKDIGIPTRLRDIGVTEDMLPGFADKAFAIKRLMRVNPRVPQSAAEILEIYRAAY